MRDRGAQGLKYEALLSHMMYLSHSDEVIAVLDQVLLLWQQAAVLGVCVQHLFGPSCLGRCTGSRSSCPYGKED